VARKNEPAAPTASGEVGEAARVKASAVLGKRRAKRAATVAPASGPASPTANGVPGVVAVPKAALLVKWKQEHAAIVASALEHAYRAVNGEPGAAVRVKVLVHQVPPNHVHVATAETNPAVAPTPANGEIGPCVQAPIQRADPSAAIPQNLALAPTGESAVLRAAKRAYASTSPFLRSATESITIATEQWTMDSRR